MADAADRRTARVGMRWTGTGMGFEAAGAGGVAIAVDGEGIAGPSPVETLLVALGSCAASDVVEILRKGRQEVRSLEVTLTGERRAEQPRRYTRIVAEVRIAGAVERAKAERALALAFEKYCSVRATLDPALPLEVLLELEP